MILVVDIGNTNIVIGVYDGDELLGNWRMVTRSEKTSDEYGVFILSLLKHSDIEHTKISSAIVSSVVPNVMHSFENALKKYFNIEPLIVGPGIKTGITIVTDNPKEVGADRIVGLVAGYDIYGGPLIVIDFGTATTYDVVSEKGEFKYGITSPGIQISADALWQRTAQLPSVEIKKPSSILAKNTVTSIQAGLVYGYIGQVEYIIKKIKEEMKIDDMKVIATGGLGRIIYEETKLIDVYDPLLLFKGLKVIHDKNCKK
ncbi:type III pantothenate kinase [Sedimentibacter hydroxybenzoicus DSM 7310]|uniref:Type III pantothenate kinase n=1 Tax=Sedimentibacter hydroxybenzoicus DSM 7310 TaxID=1123245 RepID=A0A974GUQ7_SEDHY|nr:type III pantothenate kinase [Sedimentibacter hydroxybenzoicus]NYB72548.1 type III pantothenate kinase [Sedimentibacter hydroxybenzoicus DSM 7310]